MPQATSQSKPQSRTAVAISALALLGVLDSAYLTWVHYSQAKAFCAGIGDCDLVNASPYAQVMGVPVALLGLATYLLILGLGLARWQIGPSQSGALAIFGLALAGVAYSVYLTYIEVFVLQAICIWCVISAILITGILALSLAAAARG